MAEVGLKKWMITITVILCSMLELVDISIVNVAITDMMGNLGATINDVSWVIAAYAIANVIIIPMAGFLSERFGRRNYFITSVIVFTISSVCCGLSTSIWELVAFRFVQGMAGGALLTTSQTILVETFPEEELGLANGLFGMGIIVGPTIGPTLGGVIVDNLSWHWIFFINLPIGIIATILAFSFIKSQAGYDPKAVKAKIDWLGIFLLIIGIGSLQLVLEKGKQEEWFQSTFIIVFTAISIFGIIAFIIRMLYHKDPLVDLKILKHRNVSIGTFMAFILGFGLFGTVFIYPIFTQQILGYTATQTGELLIPGALLGGVSMPIVGKLVQKGISPKYLIPIGFVVFATFTFLMASIITPNTDQGNFFIPLLLRGMGIGFLFLPLTILSLQGLKGRDVSQSAGLTNMMRQLGGSFGIAILATYLTNREQFNLERIGLHLNSNDPMVMQHVQNIINGFVAKGTNAFEAKQQAYRVLEEMLMKQAYLVTYIDTFIMLGVFFIACIPIVFLIKKQKVPGKNKAVPRP